MSILHSTRMAMRKMGVDLHRYDASQSASARMSRLLATHNVDVVLDVGANDGGYARELRDGGYRGRIVSFEPLIDVNQRLAAKAERDPLWTVVAPMALGASEGESIINVAGNSASSSLLDMKSAHVEAAPQSRFIGRQKVTVKRLDQVAPQFVGDAAAVYLKIDTQGFEYEVLQGATELLPHVVGIQLELSLVPLYEGQKLFREMLDDLSRRGFELCSVFPGFTDPRSAHMLQMDGVFFRP